MQPLFLLKESGEGAASAASHWAGLAGARWPTDPSARRATGCFSPASQKGISARTTEGNRTAKNKCHLNPNINFPELKSFQALCQDRIFPTNYSQKLHLDELVSSSIGSVFPFNGSDHIRILSC